jgi:hypothetical protein
MSLSTNHRSALSRRIQQGQHLVWLLCACASFGVIAFVLMALSYPMGLEIALPLFNGSMCLLVWLAGHRAHPRRSGGFLFEKIRYVSTIIWRRIGH